MINYPYGYGMNYNPYLANTMQQQTQTTQQGIISLPTEDEAINYPVAPGNNLIIFIEGTRIVYEKIGASQFDKPVIRRYELVDKPVDTVNVAQAAPQYVLAADFEAFKAKIEGMLAVEGGESA